MYAYKLIKENLLRFSLKWMGKSDGKKKKNVRKKAALKLVHKARGFLHCIISF